MGKNSEDGEMRIWWKQWIKLPSRPFHVSAQPLMILGELWNHEILETMDLVQNRAYLPQETKRLFPAKALT